MTSSLESQILTKPAPIAAGLDAGFDQLHVGQIIATMYLSDFVCFPVSGIMIDRLGRKYSLVSSLLLISLGCLLLDFTSGSKVLIFLNASMAGAGSGVGAGIGAPDQPLSVRFPRSH